MAEQPPALVLKGAIPHGGGAVKNDYQYLPVGVIQDEGSRKFRLMVHAQIDGDFITDFASVFEAIIAAYFPVSNANLAPMAALSIKANPTNGTAVPIDDVATVDHSVYRRSGTTNGFGPVNLAATGAAVTNALLVANGGTGATTFTAGAILTGNGPGTVQTVGPGTSGQVVISNGTTVAVVSLSGAITVNSSGVTVLRTLVAGDFNSSTDAPLTALADQNAVTINANATSGSAPPTAVAISSGHGLFNAGTTLASRYFSQRLSKSANYTAVAADCGAVIDCDTTSAGFTVTLTAAATLGAGWSCTIRKTVAANLLTIDPNGSETINGVSASQVLNAQYSYIRIVCDGTNFDLIGVSDYVAAAENSVVNAVTTGVFVNVNSISLPPGIWDVTGYARANLNAATMTQSLSAVSIFSANTVTDHVLGSNLTDGLPPTTVADSRMTIPNYRLPLTATTTVYLKFAATFSAGTPRGVGRISAVRMG